MFIITSNLYLKKGLEYKISAFKKTNNGRTSYNMVIYDRGDGCLSFIPFDVIHTLMNEKQPFYSFITYEFVTYKRKYDSFEGCINRALRVNVDVKTKRLTAKEILILDLMLSMETMFEVSKKMNNLNIKTLFSRKYSILEKSGVSSINQIVKMKVQWDKCFESF